MGYEALAAVKLALRERNEAGGVNGYMVELVALTDHQEPTTAVQRAREMVFDPDVMGVVGHFADETTLAALSTYHRAGLALVVPAATAVQITTRGYGQTFRLGADNDLLGDVAASYAIHDRCAARLAVIRGANDLSDSFVSRAIREGAEVVLDLNAADPSVLAEVSNVDPDLVFFAGEALEGADLLLSLQKAGLDIPVLGGNALNSAYLVQVAGHAAERTAYVTIAPPVEDQDFIEAYRELSGAPPGPFAALAYDAANVLLEALQTAITSEGQPTRRGVVVALSQGEDYEGLSGSISFNAQGQARDCHTYICEIVNDTYPGRLIGVGAPVTVPSQDSSVSAT